MGMLTVAGKSNHRLGLEADLKTIAAEYLLDDSTDEHFIISRLDGISKAPINLKLFTDVSHVSALVDLCLETANFLVAHLNVKSILIKLNDTLLKGTTNSTVSTLPILLLHNL